MVWERARAQELGAHTHTGWLRVRGAQAISAMGATGTPELREQSAIAPQVSMRCECKLGNCACPCEFP
eukprot:6187711-Pleurochrysis_carterae.AAC.1